VGSLLSLFIRIEKFLNLKNLVFLVSQPRAGSTLLQKMLSMHHDICTVGEPWLLLPFFIQNKNNLYVDELNAGLRNKALKVFINELSDGQQTYRDAIKEFANSLYSDVSRRTKASYFLDKTPRNYEIIDELASTFPDAKFIFLIRNPVAVICSILNTWVTNKDDPFFLRHYRGDLLDAPRKILNCHLSSNRAITVRFEELVCCPENVISVVCDFLNIEFKSSMINYGQQAKNKWRYGDQNDVYSHSSPNIAKVDKWKESLQKYPATWRIVNDYYRILGSVTIERLGYSFDELGDTLENLRPSFSNIFPSLVSCLEIPQARFTIRSRIYQKLIGILWRKLNYFKSK